MLSPISRPPPTPPDALRIRLLVPSDASAYRTQRLRALHENPQAFTSDEAEERAQTSDWSIQRLTPQAGRPHDFFLGAFEQERLVGAVGLRGRYRRKERHNATVTAMYVVPERARLGIGARLLDSLVQCARALPELTQLDLTVTEGLDRPLALYERLGFSVCGVHPAAIKVGSQYFGKTLMGMRLR